MDLFNKQDIGQPFSNFEEIHRSTYSFADDGGATGTYVAFEAAEDVIVSDVHGLVKEGFTGASMVLNVGITGTADYFAASVGSGTLVENYILRPLLTEGTPNVSKLPLRLAAGDQITLGIATAAATAGKLQLAVKVMKP